MLMLQLGVSDMADTKKNIYDETEVDEELEAILAGLQGREVGLPQKRRAKGMFLYLIYSLLLKNYKKYIFTSILTIYT